MYVPSSAKHPLFVFFIISTLTSLLSGYIGRHIGGGEGSGSEECHRFPQQVVINGQITSGYATACREGTQWKTKFLTDGDGNEIPVTPTASAETTGPNPVPPSLTKMRPRFNFVHAQTIEALPDPVRNETKP